MSNDKTIENGGPAFPYEHGHSPDACNVREAGMSLRDYFAAAVLPQCYMSYGEPTDTPTTKEEAAIIAKDAYTIADAMIAARARA